jgi:hypothetical protein
MYREEFISDAIQFRLVLTNDDDSVKEVLFTSKEYPPQSRYGAGDFAKDNYNCLMEYNEVYDFNDWENVPPMEFQYRRKSTGDTWWFLSDPVDDYMNT